MLANSKPAALTLDRNAREIAALCDKHSIPCGAPEDLAVFLRTLDENKLLAMEFWSLVARATERNPHATTDRDALLTAIIEAVTAQPLAEFESAGVAQRLLVKRTAGMLAGEDIHAPIAPGPFAAARDFSYPNIPAKQEPEPPPSPLPHRKQQLRLVLDPEPPPDAPNDDTVDARPERTPSTTAPLIIPLSAYADAEAERSALPRVLAGVLLLALIGAGWFVLRHNPSTWTRAIRSADIPAASGSKAHTAIPASTNLAQPPQPTTPPQPQTPPPQVGRTRTEQASTPAPPSPAESATAQPAASARPPEPASVPPPSPVKDSDANGDVPDSPQVVVPETLMRQNLISSRIPIAPDPAAAHGIVVLQAVITTRGTVEHLRAIDGDPALRRAAIDAASTWRYRPYLLNGTPVDVSTTISVDFSGND